MTLLHAVRLTDCTVYEFVIGEYREIFIAFFSTFQTATQVLNKLQPTGHCISDD